MKVWRLIVFDTPPPWAGMRIAKSRKCWFRVFKRRNDVLPISRRLKLDGIKYLCDKVEQQPGIPKHRPGDRGNPRARSTQGGFGGRLNAAPAKGSWRIRKRQHP